MVERFGPALIRDSAKHRSQQPASCSVIGHDGATSHTDSGRLVAVVFVLMHISNAVATDVLHDGAAILH